MPSDLMKIITDNNGDVLFCAGTDSILLLTDSTQVNPEEYYILSISIAVWFIIHRSKHTFSSRIPQIWDGAPEM